ncbi:MAG: glycosyltransferase family A protein [Alkalispirochaeta sp.]
MNRARVLSVIIPTYNRTRLVIAAIESVVSQELPAEWEMELVVVDDGSSDGTRDAVEQYARPYRSAGGRLSLRSLPHHGFPGAVRNRGVEASHGEVLAFLDSDDRWYPGKLLAQLPLHGAAQCRISHTREVWLRGDRTVSQRKQRHRRRGDIFQDALQKCIVGPSTVMMDRPLFDQVRGFREDLEVAEDYEFWLRVLATEEICFVERPFTEKRAGPWEQLSEKYGQIEAFRITALRDLVTQRYFLRRGLPDRHHHAQHMLAHKLRIYATGARKRGRAEEAARLEREAEQYHPSL